MTDKQKQKAGFEKINTEDGRPPEIALRCTARAFKQKYPPEYDYSLGNQKVVKSTKVSFNDLVLNLISDIKKGFRNFIPSDHPTELEVGFLNTDTKVREFCDLLEIKNWEISEQTMLAAGFDDKMVFRGFIRTSDGRAGLATAIVKNLNLGTTSVP